MRFVCLLMMKQFCTPEQGEMLSFSDRKIPIHTCPEGSQPRRMIFSPDTKEQHVCVGIRNQEGLPAGAAGHRLQDNNLTCCRSPLLEAVQRDPARTSFVKKSRLKKPKILSHRGWQLWTTCTGFVSSVHPLTEPERPILS